MQALTLGFCARLLAASLAALAFTACTMGSIEGPEYNRGRTRKDAGTPSPGDPPPEDDPAPPPPADPPAPPPSTPDAAPPPADPPPPPPASDSGAPPPPSDGGAAPPVTDGAPPVDSAPPPADTAPPTPPPTGAYPSGPYGFSTGSVFPNVSVSGYRDGTGAWTTIKMSDYYDPDGTRKINGILIAVSAAWCGPCREEAKSLPGVYSSTYQPRGAKFLNALIEDVSGGPAKQSTVDTWIGAYKSNFDVAADPSRVLVPSGSLGLPHNAIVDPRTMKVVKVWEGVDSTLPGLDALLTKNGG